MNADTWLVLPLYNEAAVVQSVVRDASQLFSNIVCVDDGSQDDSAREARAGGAFVVRHPVNLGQGAALQTGLDFALDQPGSEIFITFDADGQHCAEDARRMAARLRAEPLDVVFGSRFLDDRTTIDPMRAAVLRTAARLERLTSRVKLTDTHNGLRAMNRRAASGIRITQNRMAHASEIIGQIGRLGLRSAEEPVEVKYTEYSRNKGQSLWNSVNIVGELFVR